MNGNLKALYVCISDNEVLSFETNLKLFVELVNKSVPGSKNYMGFYRRFATDKRFSDTINGKEYFFQELL